MAGKSPRRSRASRRLHWERRQRGWTLEEVAAKLRHHAIRMGRAPHELDAELVGRWERGSRPPELRHLRLLSLVYDLPIEELLGLADRRELHGDWPPLRPAELGERIRAYRSRRGLTTGVLAGLVGRSGQWLERVERGEIDIRFSDLVELSAALCVRVTELVEEPFGSSDQDGIVPVRDEGVRRRHFVQYMAVLGGAGLLDWERLAAALEDPRRIDERLFDDLAELTRGYSRRVQEVAPCDLLAPVGKHLDLIRRLVADVPDFGLRRRFLTVASETATVAGWLSSRLDNRGDARMYCGLAQELAAEAGDGARRAQGLVIASDLAEDGTGAIALLDEAERAAGSWSSPLLRAWVLARRAEEHAIMGDAAASDRDIDRAEHFFAAVRSPADGVLSGWDAARMAGYRGACAVSLGRPAEATRVLERAVAATAPDVVANRAKFLTNLGAAQVQRQRVEEACASLGGALAIAVKSGLAARIQHIRRVRRTLHRWRGVSAVKQLDEQLRLAA
jgi:transcriptional regulator with XRE-family HTH domain